MHDGRLFLLLWVVFMAGVFVDRFAFHELVQEDDDNDADYDPPWLVESSPRPYDWEGNYDAQA